MGTRERPSDVTQNAKLVGDMLTGEVPNDKDEILNPPEPPGRQRSGKARAEALTPERRREIARQGATARWGG